MKKKVSEVASVTFVPSGTEIAGEYAEYQRWHVAQDACTQVRSTLAATAVFAGLGLGNSVNSRGAAAATAVFLSRDLCGSMVSLCAASLFAPKLSGDARRWRFLGDVCVDLALLLEILSARGGPALPWLLCAATALKAICGVAAGGANAAILDYFARSTRTGNFAEVAAKSNAVTTASGLLGLGLSLLATTFVSIFFKGSDALKTKASAFAYVVLTIGHLFACEKGLQLVALDRIGCLRRFRLLYATFQASEGLPTASKLAEIDRVARFPEFKSFLPAKVSSLLLHETDLSFFKSFDYLIAPKKKKRRIIGTQKIII